MILDECPLSNEMLVFCPTEIEDIPNAILVSANRKMPEFFMGLKQDKPNLAFLLQRTMAKLKLKSPTPPIQNILRTATLSEALVVELRDKALEQGLPALLEHFGSERLDASYRKNSLVLSNWASSCLCVAGNCPYRYHKDEIEGASLSMMYCDCMILFKRFFHEKSFIRLLAVQIAKRHC